MSDNMQVIIKIAERCNLNCAYCYMYTGADQSWRNRPAFLSPTLRQAFIEKCRDYLASRPQATITLEFHGGEPLLLGKAPFREFLAALREALGYERASFCLQTNGTLLDDEWCDIFEAYGVAWSISCDGPPQIHNRYRLFHSGAPSADRVEQAIKLSIARHSSLFSGVLSVIDPATDGAAIVRYFYELGVRQLDLLMPDANYTSPPAHLAHYSSNALLTFLQDAFDEWIALQDGAFRIRLFEEMMRGIYGLRSGLDAFGGNLWGMMVVESDGSYQLLDVLRIGGEDEVATNLNLASHSFNDYLDKTKDIFPDACDTCQTCPVFSVCGGGYLPHRFDGQDYDRPSIHCSVLYSLIAHIYKQMRQVTPPALWQPASGLQISEPALMT